MTKKTEEKKVKRPTAQKRELQNVKRRLQNRSWKSGIRTAIRKFELDLTKGDKEALKTSLSAVYSVVDKGVKVGVLKKNKANRTKERLAARFSKIS